MSSPFSMLLSWTYASLSLELDCNDSTNSFSCSSPSSPVTTGLITELVPKNCTVQNIPVQPSKPSTVLPPKVSKPIIKLPTASSHCCHPSLGSCQHSLHSCPNSKSELGLYHKVLTSYLKKTAEGQQPLCKAKNNILTVPAANVMTDDQWTVLAIDAEGV